MFQPLLDGYLPFSLFSIAITETKSFLFENYLWSVAVLYKIFIHHSVSWAPFGLECTLNFSPRMRTTWFLFIVCSSRNGHEYVFCLLTLLCASFWGKLYKIWEVKDRVDSQDPRQIILDNKDLLALILNSPFVIFAWCPWYKPSTLHQTILLHCCISHLPPSTLLHPWCAKAPAKKHNTSEQGLCENRTKQSLPASMT